MTIFTLIFYILAMVILVSTLLAITRRQPVHAVLYLVVAFLGTAALFFLLGAPLLAAFVVILYAGAIIILFLFVIMLYQQPPRELGPLPEWGPATLLGAIFLAVAVAMVFKDPGSGIVLRSAVVQPGDFGHFLFDRYWLAVEIVSILLLVALVAIIQLGRKGGESDDESERRVNPVRNSSEALDPAAEQRGIISNGAKEGLP